jgi:hypothetical protein
VVLNDAYDASVFDKSVCDGYESAWAEFEKLVEIGVASKRGCQIASVQKNAICGNV